MKFFCLGLGRKVEVESKFLWEDSRGRSEEWNIKNISYIDYYAKPEFFDEMMEVF